MFVFNGDIKEKILDDSVSRKVLGYGGSIMAVEVSFKKDGIGAVHSHVHEQVSYIVRGSFQVTIGDDRRTLRQGDSFYVPSGIPHGVYALEDASILDVFTPVRREFLEDL